MKETLQNARNFAARTRCTTKYKSARQIEYSYHMEVRTLNTRRMFKEKQHLRSGWHRLAGKTLVEYVQVFYPTEFVYISQMEQKSTIGGSLLRTHQRA